MKDKTRFLLLLIGDGLTSISVLLGTLFIFLDVRFMVNIQRLAQAPYLWTFTGLSNVFIGLVAFASVIFRLIKRDASSMHLLAMLKLVGATLISITVLVTLTYLPISLGADAWKLFINGSFFNHITSPILFLVTFLVFEPRLPFTWRSPFATLLPLGGYMVFYVTNVLLHRGPSGQVDLYYDIYGFFRAGIWLLPLLLIGFLGIAWGLGFLYVKLNQRKKAPEEAPDSAKA